MILALSEQAAATLSAAGFSACLAGGVALAVFALGQYMTWRLEHTKHLRQKLEDLTGAILEFQEAHLACPEKEPLKGLAPHELALRIGKLKRSIEAIQHVYFPEVSTYVGDILHASPLIMDRYLECYYERASPRSLQEVTNAVSRLCEAQKKMSPSIGRFLTYIAQDRNHLTKMPWFFHIT